MSDWFGNRAVRALAASATAVIGICAYAAPARAEVVCKTVDEFNAQVTGSNQPATSVTVKFDVTGVNPPDFFGSKGCLIDLHYTGCAVDNGYASATLKIYGPDDPPNTSHPPGTLKFEYGTDCCAAPPCGESWASPNPSETVFSDPGQQCQVEVWLDPATYGYKIDCGGTVYEAVGDNVGGLVVDQVSLLSLVDGGWDMPNALSNANEICFEQPPAEPGGPTTLTVPVLADVTASVASPSTVYSNVADLSVGADDSEIFLKFDLGAVPGQVQTATIFLHQSDGESAEGDGGDAFVVPDTSWSESTLTYGNRPATSGVALSRQSPIAAFGWYQWDVSAAVSAPGAYAFSIVPQAVDQNGAHFFSKEGSATLAPYMVVEYVVVDADGDGHPAGPDCDDASATVYPGASEVCNGADDDCDGEVDEGCAASGAGGTGAAGGDPSDGSNPVDDPGASDSGCGCRVSPRERANAGAALLLAIAAAAIRLRRPRRSRSPRGHAARQPPRTRWWPSARARSRSLHCNAGSGSTCSRSPTAAGSWTCSSPRRRFARVT